MGMSEHEKSRGQTDVWLTPLEIVRALGAFDLDPCAYPGHPTARSLFTESEDGLSKQWMGRVWLNPPYSQVERWVERLADHGRGVALVFARVDTKWAQKILPRAHSVFFPAGRIRFLRADGSAPQFTSGAPSMFLSFGERPMWPFPGWTAK